MPFTEWKQEETKRHRDGKNLFTMTSGGLVILVTNNSLKDSKYTVNVLSAGSTDECLQTISKDN